MPFEYGWVLSLLARFWPRAKSRNAERDAAATRLRNVLLGYRRQLDPMRPNDAEYVPQTHRVVLASMDDVRKGVEELLPLLGKSVEHEKLREAHLAFVAYADERFWEREGGPLSYFASAVPLEDVLAGTPVEGARRLEAELRTEAIGHYEGMIELAK